jgi:hypothetical protein
VKSEWEERILIRWLRTLLVLILVVLVSAIIELYQDSELGFGNIYATQLVCDDAHRGGQGDYL